MGLYLQKTNIIRDYYEDVLEVPPRVFYPKHAWYKKKKLGKFFLGRARFFLEKNEGRGVLGKNVLNFCFRGKYVGDVKDLLLPENKTKALQCLNELVCNAMGHTEDVIEYLSLLKEPSVLRFCGIPQVRWFFADENSLGFSEINFKLGYGYCHTSFSL